MIYFHYITYIILFLSGVGISVFFFRKKIGSLERNLDVLKTSNSEIKYILDNSEECIIIVQDSQIVFASEQACTVLGFSCTAEQNLMLASFIHCDDLDCVIEICEHVLKKDNAACCTQRVRLVSKDDRDLWCTMKSVKGRWNTKSAAIVFFRDIAEPGDIMHVQRMEAISVLSGGLAHEFNNILAAIMGNAELGLMELPDNHPGRKEFRQILDSGARATDLVKQILVMTRERRCGMTPLSLPPLIKESVRILKENLPGSITVLTRIKPDLHSVKADVAEIYQVFRVICTSAAAFARETSSDPGIEICLENTHTDLFGQEDKPGKMVPGRYVKLSVKDNSPCMSPDVEDIEPGVLSEPCFTTQEPENSKELGLTEVCEIIHRFGGELIVETQKGKGACFIVFLPAHDRVNDECLIV